MLIARALCIFAVVTLAACASTPTSTPRARVARDLGCTPEATSVQKIEDIEGASPPGARWQVSGCGQTAVYVCTTPVRDCWREGAPRPGTP